MWVRSSRYVVGSRASATRQLTAWHPDVLVSRLSDVAALVQGIAVEAETAHDADLETWAAISTEVREMLDSRMTPAPR